MKQPTERASEAAMGSRSAGVGDIDAVYAKIARRIIPFLVLLFVMAWLDRYNLGFAKLQMVKDLGFSQAVYGFGVGIVYLGYMLFEIPSNLLQHTHLSLLQEMQSSESSGGNLRLSTSCSAPSPERMVVKQPQSTRVEEPT